MAGAAASAQGLEADPTELEEAVEDDLMARGSEGGPRELQGGSYGHFISCARRMYLCKHTYMHTCVHMYLCFFVLSVCIYIYIYVYEREREREIKGGSLIKGAVRPRGGCGEHIGFLLQATCFNEEF